MNLGSSAETATRPEEASPCDKMEATAHGTAFELLVFMMVDVTVVEVPAALDCEEEPAVTTTPTELTPAVVDEEEYVAVDCNKEDDVAVLDFVAVDCDVMCKLLLDAMLELTPAVVDEEEYDAVDCNEEDDVAVLDFVAVDCDSMCMLLLDAMLERPQAVVDKEERPELRSCHAASHRSTPSVCMDFPTLSLLPPEILFPSTSSFSQLISSCLPLYPYHALFIPESLMEVEEDQEEDSMCKLLDNMPFSPKYGSICIAQTSTGTLSTPSPPGKSEREVNLTFCPDIVPAKRACRQRNSFTFMIVCSFPSPPFKAPSYAEITASTSARLTSPSAILW
jgi:hypothetical protein